VTLARDSVRFSLPATRSRLTAWKHILFPTQGGRLYFVVQLTVLEAWWSAVVVTIIPLGSFIVKWSQEDDKTLR
jgi:hypothetical protein